jgi:hypothetical protein
VSIFFKYFNKKKIGRIIFFKFLIVFFYDILDVRSSVSSESGKTVVEEKINVENFLHLVSIGYEDLLLEFWLQPATGIVV